MDFNKEVFKEKFKNRLDEKYALDVKDATPQELYLTLSSIVRSSYSRYWRKTWKKYMEDGKKQIYYFSIEFLPGRLLMSNLLNMGWLETVRDALKDLDIDLDEIAEVEKDMALGNGGLGRLASAFMDSLASDGLPGNGNGIRYRYGMFKQEIRDGYQVEVPDNWEHAQMYNLPLDEMMQVADYALNNGYTVCWDGDVSEKGFSFKNGVAINPEVKKVDDYSTTDRARFEKMDEKERLEEVYKFEKPFPEVNVTPEVRQEGFETFVTTDDHLMHLTGIAKDQNGTKYYITKNSWGTERNTFGGYLNMSDSFVRAKTIYIMVHKDAIPKAIKSKLGI